MSEIMVILLVLGFMVIIACLTWLWIRNDQRKLKARAEYLEREMKRINDRIGRSSDKDY